MHLIDASDPNRWARVRQVNSVLAELDADQIPQIRVYNKIDKLARAPRRTNNSRGEGRAVWLSAATGDGIPMLLNAISDRLRPAKVSGLVRLSPTQGRQRAALFDIGAVVSEEIADDGGWILELEIGKRDFKRFLKRENLPETILQPASAPLSAGAMT